MTYEGGKTDVEDFKGGRIRYAGIKFGYQQRMIFWAAIGTYLDQKIHEIFKRWDVETKNYPAHIRRLSIEGVERNLGVFVANIIAHRVDTDRRLRGAGYPDNVAVFDASGRRAQTLEIVKQLGRAHLQLVEEAAKIDEPTLSKKQRVEHFLSEHKGIMAGLGLLLGLAALIKYFLK